MVAQNREFKGAHGFAKWTWGVVSPRKFQEYQLTFNVLNFIEK